MYATLGSVYQQKALRILNLRVRLSEFMSTETKIRFNSKDREFFRTLKKRVDDYFNEKGISRHGNLEMIIKIIAIFGTTIGCLVLLMTVTLPIWLFLMVWGVMGFSVALIGLNICHDAIHGSLSGNATVNKVLGLAFNVVGANAYVWSITHNLLHHNYTNIPHIDEDVEAVPMVRTSPTVKRRGIHRFQHIYAFFLYGFASIAWVLLKDYKKLFSKKIGTFERKDHPRSEYVILFTFKILHYGIFLVAPMLLIDMPWYWVLVGFLFSHWIEGLTLALIFQLAHIVEGPHFPQPDQDGKIQEDWAVHQLMTTANFSRRSRVANWICGGLNYQIEHHLFPKISHVHFRDISKIVKATCEEYNLPYFENDTFMGAIRSHIRLLKVFGRQDDPQPIIHDFQTTYLKKQQGVVAA